MLTEISISVWSEGDKSHQGRPLGQLFRFQICIGLGDTLAPVAKRISPFLHSHLVPFTSPTLFLLTVKST